MSSREAILQRIRRGLDNATAAGFGDLREPPRPEVWPITSPAPAALVSRFQSELAALKGEAILCATMADARRQLAELVAAEAWPRLGSLDRPLAREITAEMTAGHVEWVTSEGTATQIEKLPAGLIAADALLADTGSCVVHCATAPERLMCYLLPACVVIAHVDQIAEHLPAAWGPIAAVCLSKESHGETVLITGPSRTADIEKKLILGVHGPKKLVVLLVG
jgi:L-lactate dehydrogenase complex protein LldG